MGSPLEEVVKTRKTTREVEYGKQNIVKYRDDDMIMNRDNNVDDRFTAHRGLVVDIDVVI